MKFNAPTAKAAAVTFAVAVLFTTMSAQDSKSPKPDFVSMVPFPSFFRERPFAGTSAAAPQAAGLAALCWSRYPNWLPQQIRSALENTALDLSIPGHDCETGYGLIRLP